MDSFTAVDYRPDFSDLPEVVLVNIFRFLPLVDRYRTSITCHTLYKIFNHPSVWQVASVRILATQSMYTDCDPIILRKDYNLIMKFGKYVQDFTLKVTGYPRNFPKEWNDVLYDFSKRCQVTTINLEFGSVTSFYHLRGKKPTDADLLPIIALISNSVQLKAFHLWSWPMFPAIFNNKYLNILYALIQNSKLKSIEKLTLFGYNGKEWTERSPLLPSPDVTFSLIENLRNLTHLRLRSPMLNKNVLKELSSLKRSRLLHFHIYVNYSSYDRNYEIPEILGRRWTELRNSNPNVEVEITIMTKIPNSALFRMLKPEVPVSAINLRKHAVCNSDLLWFIANNFKNNLRKLVIECGAPNCDEELIYVVENATNLNALVFCGKINEETIRCISNFTGRKWKTLEICEC